MRQKPWRKNQLQIQWPTTKYLLAKQTKNIAFVATFPTVSGPLKPLRAWTSCCYHSLPAYQMNDHQQKWPLQTTSTMAERKYNNKLYKCMTIQQSFFISGLGPQFLWLRRKVSRVRISFINQERILLQGLGGIRGHHDEHEKPFLASIHKTMHIFVLLGWFHCAETTSKLSPYWLILGCC